MIPTVQQGLRRAGHTKNRERSFKAGMKKLGGNFGLQYSNLFSGLPLEAGGCSFSPRLYIATAIVSFALQMQQQYPADPQAYPAHS